MGNVPFDFEVFVVWNFKKEPSEKIRNSGETCGLGNGVMHSGRNQTGWFITLETKYDRNLISEGRCDAA